MSAFKLNTSMFMKPLNQPPSAWIGHIPFAGWIIEELKPAVFVELGTHTGTSYLAFCQAVHENNVSSKCFAVDTWQGDEHAGAYSEDIYEVLRATHDEHYARFSQLMRMTFDDALAYFDDGTVDLLHIDGLHTYKAVRHDFETWLPKLSDRGVVLFHDTMVRERNFGVWKLWAKLTEQYPSFEFEHAHGLGVLLVGKKHPDSVAALAQLQGTPEGTQVLRLFESMSTRIEYFSGEVRNDSALAGREHTRKLLEQQLPAYQAQVAELNMQLGRADANARTQAAHHEQLLNELSEREQRLEENHQLLTSVQMELAAANAQLTTADQHANSQVAHAAKLNMQLGRADANARTQAAQHEQLLNELSERDQRLEENHQLLASLQMELAAANAQLTRADMQLRSADANARTQAAHQEQLLSELSERDQRMQSLHQRLEENDQLLAREKGAREQQVLLLQECIDQAHREVAERDQRLLALQEQVQQRVQREHFLATAIDRGERRIAELRSRETELEEVLLLEKRGAAVIQEMFERRQAELERLQLSEQGLQRHKAKLEGLLLQKGNEATAVQKKLEQRQAEVDDLLLVANKETAALKKTLAQREAHLHDALLESEARSRSLSNDIGLMSNSRSWRWTAPLRALTRRTRGPAR